MKPWSSYETSNYIFNVFRIKRLVIFYVKYHFIKIVFVTKKKRILDFALIESHIMYGEQFINILIILISINWQCITYGSSWMFSQKMYQILPHSTFISFSWLEHFSVVIILIFPDIKRENKVSSIEL